MNKELETKNEITENISDRELKIWLSFLENNTDTVSIPITIFVGGLIITGDLISRESYLIEVGETFSNGGGIADKFSEVFFSSAEKIKARKNSEKISPNEFKFVHLKNAEVVNYNNSIYLNLWKGKLASIDGFTYGKMESL